MRKKLMILIGVLFLCSLVLIACNSEDGKANDSDAEENEENEENEQEEGDSGGYATKTMELGEPVVRNSTLGEFEFVVENIRKIDLPEEEYTENLSYGLVFDVAITATNPQNIEDEDIQYDEFMNTEIFNEEIDGSVGVNDTWGFPELVDIPEEKVEEGKTGKGQILMSIYENYADLDSYQLVFGFGLEGVSDKLILEFTPDDIQ